MIAMANEIPDRSSVYILWVNNTRLSYVSGFGSPKMSLESSPFPFPRIGGFSLLNTTSFFLYHQLNNTAFAEDEWDSHSDQWAASTEVSILSV